MMKNFLTKIINSGIRTKIIKAMLNAPMLYDET